MIYGLIIIVTANINFLYLICSSLYKSHFKRQSLIVYLFNYLFYLFISHTLAFTIIYNKHMYAAYREKEVRGMQLLLK